MQKLDLSKYQIKQSTEPESKLAPFQEYALKVCEEFSITGIYRAIIFRQAKKNIEYLKGKVENTKEKFGVGGTKGKGRYLISLFRKNPPWIKK